MGASVLPAPPSPFEANAAAQSIVRTCSDTSEEQREQCIVDRFVSIITTHDFGAAGEVLEHMQQMEGEYQNYRSCHVLAHEITSTLTQETDTPWKQMLSTMRRGQIDATSCGGGFMHGVLEARKLEDPEFIVDAELFDSLCRQQMPRNALNSCAHILGHLALVQESGNIERALRRCESDDRWLSFRCYGGVFMEDSMRTNLHAHQLAELPNRNQEWAQQQIQRCRQYADDSREGVAAGCWYDVAEVYAQTHEYNMHKSLRFCERTAPNEFARKQCAIRASFIVALAPDRLFDAYPVRTFCETLEGDPETYRECSRKVIGALLQNSGAFMDRALDICEARAEQGQQACYQAIAQYVPDIVDSSSEKANICTQFPTAYRQACTSVRL